MASLLGGLLSSPAVASAATASTQVASAPGFVAPAPATVVHPTGLLPRFKDARVVLALTVDAAGRPQNINIVSPADESLAKQLLPAVAQWQFSPARENGVAVAVRVRLPLKLVEGADS